MHAAVQVTNLEELPNIPCEKSRVGQAHMGWSGPGLLNP